MKVSILVLVLSLFCINTAAANPLAGLSPEFGLVPTTPKSNKSPVQDCEGAEELAPGVEDLYCLGSYSAEYIEKEIFGYVLIDLINDATSEKQIRLLVSQNPILAGGAALIALCRRGIFDPNHISCGIEYKF